LAPGARPQVKQQEGDEENEQDQRDQRRGHRFWEGPPKAAVISTVLRLAGDAVAFGDADYKVVGKYATR
jgi:hypothetical protein